MRGTRVDAFGAGFEVGIIPAYAGNTGLHCPNDSGGGDHPRVCGEHLDVDGLSAVFQGSSPRMRGTLEQLRGHAAVIGIIPAYAGNT